MNGNGYQTTPIEIFIGTAHAGVGQDKKPPGRLTAGAEQDVTAGEEPVTAGVTDQTEAQTVNRQKYHGSETRRTELIAGRIAPHLKTEVLRLARLKGWTQSQMVASLIEQALAGNLAEQFGIALQHTIRETLVKELKKDTDRTANISLQSYYASEQTRILSITTLSLLLGNQTEALPGIVKESQKQAHENLRRRFGDEKEGEK